MAEQRAKIKQLLPHLWLIDDAGESTCYLIEGKTHAMLIDTANGEEDLRMTGDCLRILHKKRIEEKIAALTREAAGLKGEEKRSVLLRIQELMKERQTAGRKE